MSLRNCHHRLDGMGTEVDAIASQKLRMARGGACDGVATLRRSLIGERGEQDNYPAARRIQRIMA